METSDITKNSGIYTKKIPALGREYILGFYNKIYTAKLSPHPQVREALGLMN
jgi:hypothetical protein